METNFQAYSAYYDLLYADKQYAAEANYVVSTLKSLNLRINSLLEYGSGTGNHAIHLSREGWQITGIERSPEMVKIAKSKKIKGFFPVCGDITSYSLPERFDAVMALFHVISYLTDNIDLLNCFRNTNAHLKTDGFFIFDVWYAPAVYNQLAQPRIKKLENASVEVFRFAEPVWHYDRNVIDVNYQILVRDKNSLRTESFTEKHPMRYFSLPEIELLANQSGFRLVKTEEFLTCKAPGPATWGVCIILQKEKNV